MKIVPKLTRLFLIKCNLELNICYILEVLFSDVTIIINEAKKPFHIGHQEVRPCIINRRIQVPCPQTEGWLINFNNMLPRVPVTDADLEGKKRLHTKVAEENSKKSCQVCVGAV